MNHEQGVLHQNDNNVKRQGKTGEQFFVHQGVCQGSILSSTLYKSYINDLLRSIEATNHGVHLGLHFVRIPTCADYVLFLAD